MGGGQTVMFTSDPKIIRNEKDKVTDLELNSRIQNDFHTVFEYFYLHI